MSIVNRTPHPLTLIPADAPADALGQRVTIPAGDRGSQARVIQDCRDLGPAAEDPRVGILSGGWGRIVGLAPPQPGVLQVVSVHVVLAAVAAGRTLTDLAIPGDQVRDKSGRIVACRGLHRAADAFPRATWQRIPRLAVFGSAAAWLRDVAYGSPVRPCEAHDIDVAYCGMDEAAALDIVRDWLSSGLGRYLPRDLPLELHCLPGSAAGKLVIPRPAALVDEDGSVPLDDAVFALVGSEVDIEFEDSRTLPAIFRRALRLLDSGLAAADVAKLIAWSWPVRVDILIGEGGDKQDCYRGSSSAALRRAIAKLGDHGDALRHALRKLGLPAETVWTVATQPLLSADAIGAMRRGAPSGCGPTLRISRGPATSYLYIGPVHCSPSFMDDFEASRWLLSGEADAANMTPRAPFVHR